MIRSAKGNEANILSEISFESKGYWRYPQEYFAIWSKELTITTDYLEQNDVVVYEKDDRIVGYYAIVELVEDIQFSGIRIAKGRWLDHMFILPRFIGQGIGTKMFNHLRNWCVTENVRELGILADPNSKGFYLKMGCRYMGEFPSTIKDRTTPYMVLLIEEVPVGKDLGIKD